MTTSGGFRSYNWYILIVSKSESGVTYNPTIFVLVYYVFCYNMKLPWQQSKRALLFTIDVAIDFILFVRSQYVKKY